MKSLRSTISQRLYWNWIAKLRLCTNIAMAATGFCRVVRQLLPFPLSVRPNREFLARLLESLHAATDMRRPSLALP
jgi:hypothetical protein